MSRYRIQPVDDTTPRTGTGGVTPSRPRYTTQPIPPDWPSANQIKGPAGLIIPPGTRFGRELLTRSILNDIQKVSGLVRQLPNVWIGARSANRFVFAPTDVPEDPQFELEVQFSPDDGYTFDAPLVQPLPDRLFQIRLRFSQHVGERDMLRGTGIEWILPTGWTFADGLDAVLYDECVSNPMVVTRLIRSPAAVIPAGFRLVVTSTYR